MKRLRCRVALLLAALSIAACEGQEAEGGASPWTFHRSLVRAGRVELVAPEGALRRTAVELALRLEAATPYRAVVLYPVDLERAGQPAGPRVVLGTLDDPDTLRLAEPLGLVRRPDGSFDLLGHELRGRGDGFVATFEDPTRPGSPLVLALGRDAKSWALLVDHVPSLTRAELEIWQAGDPVLRVPLDFDGAPRFEERTDLDRLRARRWDGATVLPAVAGLAIRHEAAASPTREFLAGLRRAHRRAAAWLAPEGQEMPAVQVLLYAHTEDLAADLGTPAAVHVNPVIPRVYALFSPDIPSSADTGVAHATAVTLAGAPAASWMLDGLGVAAAGTWWGRPLEDWTGHLVRAGLAPSAGELVRADADLGLDRHVLAPLRGILFRVIARESEPVELRRIWSEGLAEIDEELSMRYERALDRLAEEAGAVRQASDTHAFDHGVALAEGDAPQAGYGSRALASSLAEAQALGATAFSLLVRGSLEPQPPALVAPRRIAVHGSASDLALASAVAEGRRLGMRCLLQVLPMARPWSGFTDDVRLGDAAVNAEVFERTGRIALHYALLAELLGIDVLCVASELTAISPSLPDAAAPEPAQRLMRLEAWTELIRSLRAAYGGQLTYAARAGAEVRAVGFWDQLDAIGVNLFPGFKETDGAVSAAVLVARITRELAVLRELGRARERPVIVVQIGFPSRDDAWSQPALPFGAPDPEPQRRFYEALALALADEGGRAGLAGIFLWNWPVDPARGGVSDGGYTPRGKPAQELVPEVFGR